MLDWTLIPVRWSDLEHEDALGPEGVLVYRLLLDRRSRSHVVAAPVKDVASWIKLKPAKVYAAVRKLETVGLLERVRAPRSRTGKGLHIYGELVHLGLVGQDGPHAFVRVPTHTARWVRSGFDSKHLVYL